MKPFFSINMDFAGFCASSLCAIHCMITPFIMVLFPFVKLSVFGNGVFEVTLLITSVFLGFTSLLKAYYKAHTKAKPLLFLVAGFTLLLSGQFVSNPIAEIPLSVAGGFGVAWAHLRNHKLVRKHKA